jgi:WD40 repeat protein
MTCPKCSGVMTRGQGFWICLNCGQKTEEGAKRAIRPLHGLSARLPHALALPLSEYSAADNGYERLHRLTDAAELWTRFCAAVVLADLLDEGPGHSFPEKVQDALLDRLERPTFGAWAGLLETAVKALARRGGKIQCIVPELPAFVLDKLLPLLGGSQTLPEEGIIALRNVLAHSGRLSETDERRFLDAHAPRFEQLIEDASFFAKVQVVGSPAPGKAFLLHGVPDPGMSFLKFDLGSLPAGVAPPQSDRLLLIAANRAIDLFPLHAYGDVFHYLDKTREEVRATGKAGTDPRANFEPVPEASPATLLYFRRGAKDYLEYTSLSPYAAHSQEGFAALERFRQVFQLEQWRRNAEARQGRKEFDFADWRKELLELFVGRSEQVRQVADWAKQTSTGICWISGHPGVGKSAFMADLAERFFSDDKHYCKIVHFFRGADPRCNRMKFLENALTSLWASFGKAESLEADPQKRGNQFRLRLAEISREQAAEPEKQRRRIVFLLDGLDEVLQNDREFAELIFENLLAGVLWICAGRDVNELGKRMREQRAHEPFGEDGLPVLTDGDLREILDKECGRQIYELIARDRPETPPNGNSNPFLEALVARSQGLPLYLRLVVQDIREGKLSFKEGEEKKLPRGLASYYERVLERLQISDVAAVLTEVFCVLACAKAPLTIETLLELMKDDRLIREGGEKLLRRALDFGHLMLKRVTITEQRNVGEEGEPYTAPAYVLYHESFRDHLLATDTVKYAIKAACTSLVQLSSAWAKCEDRLFVYRYVLRFAPQHLTEREDWGRLETVLTSLFFVQAKCEAGMMLELWNDYRQISAHGGPEEANNRIQYRASEGVRAFYQFVRMHGDILAEAPSTTFQLAANQPNESPLVLAAFTAETPLDNKPWVRWKNKSATSGFLVLFDDARANNCVYSKDGRYILCGGSDGKVKIWDAETGALERTINAHLGPTKCLYSGDGGSCIISAPHDEGESIKIWDRDTGKMLRSIEYQRGTWQLALSADGQFLALTSRACELTVIDLYSGREALRFRGHTPLETSIPDCGFSPGSSRLLFVALGENVGVRLFDLNKVSEVFTAYRSNAIRKMWASDYGTRAICGAFSSDGKSLALGCEDGSVRLYDGSLRRLLLRGTTPPYTDAVWCCIFSPDNTMYACGRESGTLTLHDRLTGAVVTAFRGHSERIMSCAFSPDSSHVVSCAAGTDRATRVWDVEYGKAHKSTSVHSRRVNDAACFRSVPLALTVSGDGTGILWDTNSARPAGALESTSRRIIGCAIHPDDAIIGTVGEGGLLRLQDRTNGAFVRSLGKVGRLQKPNEVIDSQSSCSFSPTGATILHLKYSFPRLHRSLLYWLYLNSRWPSVVGNWFDHKGRIFSLILYDTVTGRCLRRLGALRPVQAVATLPDGSRMIVCQVGKIKLLDVRTGKTLSSVRRRNLTVRHCAVYPDCTLALVITEAGSAELLTISGDRILMHPKKRNSGPELGCAFSPDGLRMVDWQGSGAVGLWRVNHSVASLSESKRPLMSMFAALRGCPNPVGGVGSDLVGPKFSSDGKLFLAIASGRLYLWDTGSGQKVGEFRGIAALSAATMAHDCKTIVCGDVVGNVYILEFVNYRSGPIVAAAVQSPADSTFAFRCPRCQSWIQAPGGLLGLTGPCPLCDAVVRITHFSMSRCTSGEAGAMGYSNSAQCRAAVANPGKWMESSVL